MLQEFSVARVKEEVVARLDCSQSEEGCCQHVAQNVVKRKLQGIMRMNEALQHVAAGLRVINERKWRCERKERVNAT